jgi:exonuclease SbcC
MSYGFAEIDFSGIHVACLSGQNGAGKSSLLDAITWTLWEEGRARTDELIKLGQNEMSTELDFFMEEDLYRVYRSRNKSFKNSQGKSNLEFQIFDPKENMWRSLSLNTTRLTQELIIKTLKMDYPTFVNSVYLRQGKADEFTTKKPSERKQILADILGLEVYDKLCELSRIKMKEVEQNIFIDQGLISALKEKCEKEDELKLKTSEIKEKLIKEEIALEKIEEKLTLKEKELNEKKEKEKQIKTLENSRNSHESLLKTLESQILSIKQKEEKYNSLIRNKSEIEKDYSGYLSDKERFEVLEKEKEQFNKLTLEKSKLELGLKEKIQKIDQELAVYKSKISERSTLKIKLNEKLQGEDTLKTFLGKAQNEIKEFKNLQELLVKIETQALEIKHEKELISLDVKKFEEKKVEISEKVKTINSHNHAEPCPLCKSPIQDKKKVIESFEIDLKEIEIKEKALINKAGTKEKEVQNKREEYLQIKEKINNYGKIIASMLPELSNLKKEKVEMKSLEKPKDAVSFFESQLEVLRSDFEKTKEQMITIDSEMNNYEKEISSLHQMMSSGEAIKDLSERLKNISSEISSIKYDEIKYLDLRKSIKEKELIVNTFNLLTQAEQEIKIISLEKENLSLKMKSGFEELEKLKNLIIENKKQINGIEELMSEVSIIKNEESEKSDFVKECRRELILHEQLLKDIENSKKQINEKEERIKSSLDDKKHYEILEKAFSKNGIQAAIIETVVPEIENEANRILTRLTENQMHVALRTQKEKKTGGGLVETLDVVIADNAGTRNYELYSGGEAFKIDFALRLALSRLLSNRSGAKLKTLIIDEGFGSQDAAGKERLTEVIRSIQNEFELILVVTHIEELKEAFPTMIQVTKDDEGSRVKVFG